MNKSLLKAEWGKGQDAIRFCFTGITDQSDSAFLFLLMCFFLHPLQALGLCSKQCDNLYLDLISVLLNLAFKVFLKTYVKH